MDWWKKFLRGFDSYIPMVVWAATEQFARELLLLFCRGRAVVIIWTEPPMDVACPDQQAQDAEEVQ